MIELFPLAFGSVTGGAVTIVVVALDGAPLIVVVPIDGPAQVALFDPLNPAYFTSVTLAT